MIPQDEVSLKLSDLRQAVEYERKHQLVDIQGRRKPFSTFARETLQSLSSLVALHHPVLAEPMAPLVEKYRRYPLMDIAFRMQTLQATEDWITSLLSAQAASPSRRLAQQAVTAQIAPGDNLLENPVASLEGVGPRMATLLAQVSVETVGDLLYHFPRRYLDYHHRAKIRDLKADEDVTLLGRVRSIGIHPAKRRNLLIVQMVLEDETGRLPLSWFYGGSKMGQSMARNFQQRFQKGADVMVSGHTKWDKFQGGLTLDRAEVELLSYQDSESVGEDSLHAGRIVPVYPLTEGLSLRFLRKAIHQALETCLRAVEDPMPTEIQSRYGLMGLSTALRQVHFPDTLEQAQAARRRLVFDELFFLQARLALLRAQYKQQAALHGQSRQLIRHPDRSTQQFLENLPFQLTGAQQRVFGEICGDLASVEPMYRLLHGDVGSGKTVIAALTLLVGVENGYQGALMAPTEILAEQHYRRFVEWLTPLGLKAGLFVGKAGSRERRQLRQELLNGQIHIAIGTHALIQDDVEFQNLGVVVVDEQHRFGVRQRTQLKAKGQTPEMLTMTATPIPRTLAMTLHGDLDISTLDEQPPGRSPIQTVLLPNSRHREAYALIRQEVVKGRQAYVVLPLIEESETISAKAATTEAERLQKEVFPEYRIGLLHGKMAPHEKDAVMHAFVNHHLDILVATTVVEVGVDVPNASVMIIESAERFGLAQLHQIRGRVGRGQHQSYCLLMSSSTMPETVQRLNVLVETENGFVIAERDLELRGPGDFIGTRQSGLPDLLLADLLQDKTILEEAREAAFSLVQDPARLAAYPELEAVIHRKTEAAFSVLGAG